MNNYFKTLKHILEGGYNITFLSGAGISTASGLPDFRGDKDGFWKNRPVHFSEFKTSKKARLKSWENNIAIQNKIQKAQPTKMHKVINEILKFDGPLNFHIPKILMDYIKMKILLLRKSLNFTETFFSRM